MHALANTCFNGIPTDTSVIVAVSGGSDSIALLLLSNIWARKHDVHLQAITIDHGLRPEAAAEASFVASICASLEIDHITLAWEGIKPSFGIQNAARQSRYNLLDQFAQEIGSDVILTGHTLDDQIETVYMRNQRHVEGGEGKGLSGMARQTWLYGGTQIYRPLLEIRRKELRKILTDFSQSWVEDPSNFDESYERVRVRNKLAKDPSLADQYLRLANVCGRLRETIASDCATYLHKNFSILPGPVFELKLQLTRGSIHPIVLKAIQIVIGLGGGQDYLVPVAKLQPIIEDLMKKDSSRANIGGAILEVIKGESGPKLQLYREMRNIKPAVLEPGDSTVWDGRLFIYNETASTVFVEPPKKEFLIEYEKTKGEKFEVKPRKALSSTPVIHVQVPNIRKDTGPSVCLPLVDASTIPNGLHVRLAPPSIEHFCPQFDEAIRMWVMSLDRFSAASISPKG